MLKQLLLEKININGQELSPKEFRKKYKISSNKYYKALNSGLTHIEIVKNIDLFLTLFCSEFIRNYSINYEI